MNGLTNCSTNVVGSLSRVWLFGIPMNCSMPGFPVLPSPWACSNSCPLSHWCHLAIFSSAIPFSSSLQSFPASGSFLMSWHQSFQWIFRLIYFRIDWFDLLAIQGTTIIDAMKKSWRRLPCILLNERYQSKKPLYCMIPTTYVIFWRKQNYGDGKKTSGS